VRSIRPVSLRANSDRPFLNGDGFYAFPGGDVGGVDMNTMSSGTMVSENDRNRGASAISENMSALGTKGG